MDKIKRASKRDFFIGQNMIFDLDISEHAKLTYLYLCRCADSEGQCFPSYATISTRCSFSKRTAIKAIQELQKIGLLSVENRKIHKHGKPVNTSNLYILHDSPDEGVVHQVHYPSAPQTLPLVHQVHYPSAPGAPITIPNELNPIEQNNNNIETENAVVKKTDVFQNEIAELVEQVRTVTSSEQVQVEGLKPILNLPDGIERLKKAIKTFPEIAAQTKNIKSPVGLLLYIAEKDISPVRKITNNSQTKTVDFARYPQHQYAAGDLDQLFEPIG